ncbi:TPA: hypothetical protein KDY89_004232 [Vibrio parahaemolyticus]|nr:hypothetical protein [Vibrio parahaemolyticus]
MNQHVVENIATSMEPQAFEIRPSKGKSLLLYGWLRTFAQYEVQWPRSEEPFPNATGGVHIRQDVYESTDGQWLFVETMLDSNAALGHQRDCHCWHYSSKADIRAPFRFHEHTREMFARCELPYQTIIGQLGEKA